MGSKKERIRLTFDKGVLTHPDKIINAVDVARHHGMESATTWRAAIAHLRGHRIDKTVDTQHPVYAQISHGRWIAVCECGGAEYVTPDDPVFFCNSCGNRIVSHRLRKVIFPKSRKRIEKKLLSEPLEKRNWTPKEVKR